MDEIDGFESPTQGKQAPPRPHAMTNFTIDKGLNDVSLEVANDFKNIAEAIADCVPEGTVRTMLFEKLTDIRGATLRALRDFKK